MNIVKEQLTVKSSMQCAQTVHCSVSVIAKHSWTQWNRRTDGFLTCAPRCVEGESMRCGKKWRLNFGSEKGEIDCFFASNLKFTIFWRTTNEEVHIWRKTHSRTHWLFCWKETESRSLIRKRTAVIMNCTKISLSIKAFNRTALLYDVGARRHVLKGNWNDVKSFTYFWRNKRLFCLH